MFVVFLWAIKMWVADELLVSSNSRLIPPLLLAVFFVCVFLCVCIGSYQTVCPHPLRYLV